MNRYKLCVLLSTYNGERFLREQLDSIAAQTLVPHMLMIRDDGSSDRTFDIIEEFRSRSQIDIVLFRGENVGPQISFRILMNYAADTDADVFFLCDQDDIWEANKVELFCHEFSQLDSPELVFSRQLLVNENNVPIGLSSPVRRVGFGNALIENVVTGCSAAFNRACLEVAREDIESVSKRTIVSMHDWWLYIVASAFGKVIYIDLPLTRYRQHDGNVVGKSSSVYSRFFKRIRRFLKGGKHKISYNSSVVLDVFGQDLNKANLIVASLVASSRSDVTSRLRLTCSIKCWRQSYADQFLWRFLCLIGHY